jgi:hypothetical protein
MFIRPNGSTLNAIQDPLTRQQFVEAVIKITIEDKYNLLFGGEWGREFC